MHSASPPSDPASESSVEPSSMTSPSRCTLMILLRSKSVIPVQALLAKLTINSNRDDAFSRLIACLGTPYGFAGRMAGGFPAQLRNLMARPDPNGPRCPRAGEQLEHACGVRIAALRRGGLFPGVSPLPELRGGRPLGEEDRCAAADQLPRGTLQDAHSREKNAFWRFRLGTQRTPPNRRFGHRCILPWDPAPRGETRGLRATSQFAVGRGCRCRCFG
jgi:hypothetical protein